MKAKRSKVLWWGVPTFLVDLIAIGTLAVYFVTPETFDPETVTQDTFTFESFYELPLQTRREAE